MNAAARQRDSVTPAVTTPETPAVVVTTVAPPAPPELSLERGFVASLRWLVAEGDARGVRRLAVELRALHEVLATLDETRTARDEEWRLRAALDQELQEALALLGPGTAVHGGGSLVERLTRLRDRVTADAEARQQLVLERDAWRAMCTLLTHARAGMEEQLEQAGRERDRLRALLLAMRTRVRELVGRHEATAAQAEAAREELASLREQLRGWTGTVERALEALSSGPRAPTE